MDPCFSYSCRICVIFSGDRVKDTWLWVLGWIPSSGALYINKHYEKGASFTFSIAVCLVNSISHLCSQSGKRARCEGVCLCERGGGASRSLNIYKQTKKAYEPARQIGYKARKVFSVNAASWRPLSDNPVAWTCRPANWGSTFRKQTQHLGITPVLSRGSHRGFKKSLNKIPIYMFKTCCVFRRG